MRIKRVGRSFWWRGWWNNILLIIMVKSIVQSIKPIAKRNKEISQNQSFNHAIGAIIFQTTGINHKGFISFISISFCIHLLSIIIVKINCIIAPIIQRYFAKIIWEDINPIAKRKSILPTHGKKFDFTLWAKSAFTSSKFINIFMRYSQLMIIKYRKLIISKK